MGRFLALALASALQLLTVVASIDSPLPQNTHFHHASNQTYDFIIVGGGLSGLVVANRLSEDPTKSVLVIENGYIDNGPLTSVPYEVWNPNQADWWNISSAPEPFFDNQTFGIRVGSVVGGGTIINGMAIDRATDSDYDAWEMLGNVGWGYAGLAPYFKKFSHFTPPSASSAEAFNITYDASAFGNGPVEISIPSYEYSDEKILMDAYRAEPIAAPREGFASPLGVYWFGNDINNATATRAHAQVSYYDPVQNRTNLKLLQGTTVNQILFDKNLVATGVQIVSRADGSVAKVYANKEVVLAAGAIFSPHLLLLSGIGPKDVLAAANVTVKLDAPGVGSNFQDHPIFSMTFNLTNQTWPNQNTIFDNPTFLAAAEAQYEATRQGPKALGRSNAAAFLTFNQFSTKYQNLTSRIANQDHATYLPVTYTKNPTLLSGFKKQRDLIVKGLLSDETATGEIPIQAWGHSTVAFQKPLSRGTITLNNTDPQNMPIVQWNAMTNPIEAEIMVELLNWNRRHWARPELARYSPVENTPGAQYSSTADLMQQGITNGYLQPTFSHPSCSNPMMPQSLGGVVSDQLLVYGTKQLSIVDASVIPLIPATHLQATIYAISEKAADLIKARNP